MTDEPSLGPCCICETNEGVRNVLMIDRRCPTKGHGWGCCLCRLDCDGAVAVLCDPCLDRFQADNAALRFVCTGYASNAARTPFAELAPDIFEHNEALHAAVDLADMLEAGERRQ